MQQCFVPTLVLREWGWRLTLPSEFLFWELGSWWTPKPSKGDYRGQNTSHWGVLYIIEKLFKCRCLKWAQMTHLDICNISYGKKKGWESNWLLTTKSRESTWPPCVQVACNTPLEPLNKNYNFASDLIPIRGLNADL
jgi:hypothetical protein